MVSEKSIAVFIVDEDTQSTSILKTALEKEKFEVHTFTNSQEALEKAILLVPNLILLDVSLKNMDGIELCSELRAVKHLRRSLIVFYSSQNEDYSQIAAFNAGADDYVLKPTKISTFIARVNALMKRAIKFQKKQEIPSNGILINREEYLVYKNGKELFLPRKEFELLSTLFATPKKIFTREELANIVWGYEIQTDSRTIDVHIRKLREKLGKDYIRTIKGVGYSIDNPNA